MCWCIALQFFWYLTDSWLWLSQHTFLAFLTSVPLYVHPGWSFRSSGNCKWSASFSSQVTLSFSIDGPMLTDTHLLSMRQRCSHGVYIPIERFKKMWLSRRLPSTGGTNLRRRQPPAKKQRDSLRFEINTLVSRMAPLPQEINDNSLLVTAFL